MYVCIYVYVCIMPYIKTKFEKISRQSLPDILISHTWVLMCIFFPLFDSINGPIVSKTTISKSFVWCWCQNKFLFIPEVLPYSKCICCNFFIYYQYLLTYFIKNIYFLILHTISYAYNDFQRLDHYDKRSLNFASHFCFDYCFYRIC